MTILVATAYMEEAGNFEQLVAMHEAGCSRAARRRS